MQSVGRYGQGRAHGPRRGRRVNELDSHGSRENDTDRYRARSSIQASRRGGRTKSTGSKPIDQNGLTRLRSPNEAPVPDRPKLRPDPDGSSAVEFMPRRPALFRDARRTKSSPGESRSLAGASWVKTDLRGAYLAGGGVTPAPVILAKPSRRAVASPSSNSSSARGRRVSWRRGRGR
jgi:hypothetical protein